jgi:hypothetical protein
MIAIHSFTGLIAISLATTKEEMMKPEELVCDDLKPQKVGGLMAPHVDDAGDFYYKQWMIDKHIDDDWPKPKEEDDDGKHSATHEN